MAMRIVCECHVTSNLLRFCSRFASKKVHDYLSELWNLRVRATVCHFQESKVEKMLHYVDTVELSMTKGFIDKVNCVCN